MKSLFSFLFAMCLASIMLAQTTVNVTGDISTNTTWVRSKVYVLSSGFHYVKNNATLTIQSGTIIRSDNGTLVITRGSKINAIGTVTRPIVFTSNKAPGSRAAGDNGGIIILGRAAINDPAGERLVEGGLDANLGKYGPGPGQNPINNDNSGTLKYVRIEYGGTFYLPNNEVNGLTMAGVGSGTSISYIQVTNGLDDSFEWFGGTVDAKYIVSLNALDDDLDTDYGFNGKVQFGLVVRDPNSADVSRSNMFESDNDATGTTNAPFTSCTFSNITGLGPIRTSPANTFSSLYGRAAHIRRSSRMNLHNSVLTGYPVGLMIDGANTLNAWNSGNLQIKNNLLAGITGLVVDSVWSGTAPSLNVDALYTAGANTTNTNVLAPAYKNPYPATTLTATSPTNLDFRTVAGSPVLSGSSFTGLNAFFTNTTFIGAFNTAQDWTDCWASFNAQFETYAGVVGGINYSKGITIAPAGSATLGTVLTANGGAGATYKWFRNNAALPGASSTQPTFTANVAGTYKCRVITNRGCSVFTSETVVGTGLVENTNNEVVSFDALDVFPNPASDRTVVAINGTSNASVNVTIVDMMGRVVNNQTIDITEGTNQLEIETATFPRGMYIVNVKEGNNASSIRLILE